MPTFLYLIHDNFAQLVALLVALAGAVSIASLLYGMLAVTYGVAAKAARKDGHRLLARCYITSAGVHAVLGVCHHFHI